jgi:hypothetical protein
VRAIRVVAAVTVVAVFAATRAHQAAAADPAQELAKRYAPVVRLVAQKEPCGHGEAYDPAAVNVVLGNPGVALRGPWDRTNLVKVAPTARDLSRGLFEYHLDFPGNPLSPGCTYDEWARRITAHSRKTVYAHLARDPAHPRQTALQYWSSTSSTTSTTNTRATGR